MPSLFFPSFSGPQDSEPADVSPGLLGMLCIFLTASKGFVYMLILFPQGPCPHGLQAAVLQTVAPTEIRSLSASFPLPCPYFSGCITGVVIQRRGHEQF